MFFQCKKKTYKIKFCSLQTFQIKTSNNYRNFWHAIERISPCPSFRGSLTIEAALVFPVFMFAVLGLMYLMIVFRLQADIGQAMASTAKELGQYAYVYDKNSNQSHAAQLSVAYVKQKVEECIEKDSAAGMILDGKSGIHYLKSRILQDNSMIDLVVYYNVKLPLSMLGIESLMVVQRERCRAWVGYAADQYASDSDEVVYVTKDGMVYHKTLQCTHLNLSIHQILSKEIEVARNESGEKYYPCEECWEENCPESNVYITNNGNRYHRSLNCSGLKRTVYMVLLSEVAGKKACLRCGT